MSALLLIVFSFTRAIAQILIKKKWIKNFWGIIGWNYTFYCLIASLITYYSINIVNYDSKLSHIILILIIIATISRINELVIAFYGEAIGRARKDRSSRLGIKPSERITLLTLAYGETILQFGILYFSIFCLLGHDAFNTSFSDIRDALYLSGLTITTTGYGDILPKSHWCRLACVYEALIGIVFIAMALAAYLGGEAENKPS